MFLSILPSNLVIVYDITLAFEVILIEIVAYRAPLQTPL